MVGVMVGLAALAYAFLVFFTGNQGPAQTVLIRILELGLMVGVIAAFSRWVCGGETNSLYSSKLIKGDLGGATGWVVGMIFAGFLTPAGLQGLAIKQDEGKLGKSPVIVGPTLDGGQFDLAEKKGKVVLIDFWATWCRPCIEELPNIQDAYDAFHEKGLEVVSISLDESRQEINRFLKTHPHPWPQIYFDKEGQRGFSSPLAKEYGIDSIPRIWLINQDGKLISNNLRGPEIVNRVADLLGQDVPVKTRANLSPFMVVEWLVKGALLSSNDLFWGLGIGMGLVFAIGEALLRKIMVGFTAGSPVG